jgi:methylenetetrahydrofolate reductase (NADPH)
MNKRQKTPRRGAVRQEPWSGRKPEVSFEFFPPKTAEMEGKLWSAIRRLESLGPSFVSVTYGAGGTTRQRTHATVERLLADTSLTPAAHLTCVGARRHEIDAVARRYWAAGVRHLVALRGDPRKGGSTYQPHPDGYAFAADLVAGLKRVADFEISVACYPEIHPEAASPEADLDNLKRKLDNGATRAITQFFLDTGAFLRFRERAAARGIFAPIVPGLLPITNVTRTLTFARACGAQVPDWFARLFEGLDDDPQTRTCVAAAIAAEQCRLLQAEGVEDFHFYTLNRAELTRAVCRMIGIIAAPAETEPAEATALPAGARP